MDRRRGYGDGGAMYGGGSGGMYGSGGRGTFDRGAPRPPRLNATIDPEKQKRSIFSMLIIFQQSTYSSTFT